MNTLTKNFVKRGLSLFLTVLLVFSLFTVGITSASAADVEVAETGADTMTIYFRNDWNWTDICLYFWGSSTATNPSWPGNSMKVHSGNIYKLEIPSDITGMIFNGLKDDGSGNRDQSPDIESGWQDGLGYYMYWENGNTVRTFDDYVVTTTLEDVNASVADGPFTIGDEVEINVTYTFSDTSNTTAVPTITLYNTDDTAVDASLYDVDPHTPDRGVINLSTESLSAGEHTYKVKVSYGDLNVASDPVTFTLRNELSAKLSVAPESGYVNNSFVFTVEDNAVSDSYGTPAYALYKEDGTLVESTWNGNTTTVVLDTTGEQKYYATVTVEGFDPVKTELVPVNVTEFTDFGFTANYPTSVQAGVSITITASLKGSVPYPVTYVLTNNDNTTEVIESETGKFTIPTDTTNIGATKSYTLTAYAMVGDKRVDSTTSIKIDVDVTEITETRNVTIYFKSTDTLGYAPYATVVGMKESKTDVRMEKAAYIPVASNPSGTAQYWWYSISVEVSTATPSISFNVVSERYSMEHTVEFEAVNSEYWFAVDNLNTNQTTDKDGNTYNYSLIDVSSWTDAKRNWTQSAAHMLWDDDVDGLWVEDSTNSDEETAQVAAQFRAVSVGDANDDGIVNIKDTTYIQKVLAGLETADTVSRAVSDVDGDNTVTIKDATAIQKKIAGCL